MDSPQGQTNNIETSCFTCSKIGSSVERQNGLFGGSETGFVFVFATQHVHLSIKMKIIFRSITNHTKYFICIISTNIKMKKKRLNRP